MTLTNLPAAIDGDDGPSDEGRFFRCKIQRCLRHIIGGAEVTCTVSVTNNVITPPPVTPPPEPLPPPEPDPLPPEEPALLLAIVGRRNAGKSTFINSLAGAERVIVSEVPGTTRDSVDVRFEKGQLSVHGRRPAGRRRRVPSSRARRTTPPTS